MQSKTSFFSFTMYKKNILSFILIPIVYLFLQLCMLPLNLYSSMNSLYSYSGNVKNLVEQTISSQTNPILVSIAAMVGTVTVFYFLYNTKHTYMIHALPLSRKTLFITNIASVYTMLFVPQLITAIVVSIQINAYLGASYIWMAWIWLLFEMMMGILFVSIALLAVMFTGQLVTAGFFFFVINFLFIICYNVFLLAKNALVYGSYVADMAWGPHIFTPYRQLWYEVGLMPSDGNIYYALYSPADVTYAVTGFGTMGIYMAVAIVFTVAAWFCYKYRQLECAKNFLSFTWLGYIFRWGVSSVISILFGYIVAYAANHSSDIMGTSGMCRVFFIATILLGIVVFMVAEMIVKKSFRIFHKAFWIECFAYTAVIAIAIIVMYSGALGSQKKIPAKEDIKEVSISEFYYSVSSDKEEILDLAIDLHSLIIDNLDTLKRIDSTYDAELGQFITINYYLKNGKDFTRRYYIPFNSGDADLEAIISMYNSISTNRAYVETVYLQDNTVDNLVLASVNYVANEENGVYIETVDIPNDMLVPLMNALYQDMDEGHLPASVNDYSVLTANTIYFEFSRDDDFTINGLALEYPPNSLTAVDLTVDCTNVRDFLIDNGIIPEGSFMSYEAYESLCEESVMFYK